jgi:ferredoxin-fold anticodon binding domain-containing protein
MNKETIQTAQEYLTVATKENGKKKIMDIDQLFENHSSEEVIQLLKTILKEKQVALRDFILKDKARPEIDETVAVMFRITMAIKTIQNGKEVRDVDDRAK